MPEKTRCDFVFTPWGYRCVLHKGHEYSHRYVSSIDINEYNREWGLLDEITKSEVGLKRSDPNKKG